MAEREGFEPTVQIPSSVLIPFNRNASGRAVSATFDDATIETARKVISLRARLRAFWGHVMSQIAHIGQSQRSVTAPYFTVAVIELRPPPWRASKEAQRSADR